MSIAKQWNEIISETAIEAIASVEDIVASKKEAALEGFSPSYIEFMSNEDNHPVQEKDGFENTIYLFKDGSRIKVSFCHSTDSYDSKVLKSTEVKEIEKTDLKKQIKKLFGRRIKKEYKKDLEDPETFVKNLTTMSAVKDLAQSLALPLQERKQLDKILADCIHKSYLKVDKEEDEIYKRDIELRNRRSEPSYQQPETEKALRELRMKQKEYEKKVQQQYIEELKVFILSNSSY